MIIAHVTTTHSRDDIRVFWKECVSLQNADVGSVNLVVADGRGNDAERGVAIIDVGKGSGSRLKRKVVVVARVWHRLRSLAPGIVHIHDPELLIVGFLLRRRGQLVIYDMHENFPKQLLTKEWVYRSLRRILARLASIWERVLLREIPVIFAEESYAQEYRWVTDSEVVLNLPDLGAIARVGTHPLEECTIGYIGGVTAQRGINTVLLAISQLRAEGMEVKFECVGPVSEEVEQHALYKQSIEEGWARFPGRLSAGNAWGRISGCLCGLAILHPSPNYVDSFPTKIYEYMALGIPVIASDFPLYRRAIEEAGCGLVVNPLDVQAIGDAMRWIVRHPEEAKAMGNRGKREVSLRYDWRREAEKLVSFYGRQKARIGLS